MKVRGWQHSSDLEFNRPQGFLTRAVIVDFDFPRPDEQDQENKAHSLPHINPLERRLAASSSGYHRHKYHLVFIFDEAIKTSYLLVDEDNDPLLRERQGDNLPQSCGFL